MWWCGDGGRVPTLLESVRCVCVCVVWWGAPALLEVVEVVVQGWGGGIRTALHTYATCRTFLPAYLFSFSPCLIFSPCLTSLVFTLPHIVRTCVTFASLLPHTCLTLASHLHLPHFRLTFMSHNLPFSPCPCSPAPEPGPPLPCPALPCPALPCPALPCPALPCPALPCPALTAAWACPNLPPPLLRPLLTAAPHSHAQDLTATGKADKLKGFEIIKAVHLDATPFSVEADLLTPTFKLKRPQMLKKFQAEVDALYKELKE